VKQLQANQLRPLTGSVQIKKGKLYLVINTYTKGERKPVWIPTGLNAEGNYSHAEYLLSELLGKYIEQQQLSNGDAQLFSEYLIAWLNSRKSCIELSTWEHYQSCIERHIAPFFRDKGHTLTQLSRRHVKEYYDFKASSGRLDGKEGGLSAAALKKHSCLIKMALDEAALMELIPYNPAQHVPITKVISNEVEKVFLTTAEAKTLLRILQGHELYEIVYITLYFGLRRSEVLGLRWCDINFNSNTLHIRNTIVRSKTMIEKERTKTKASKAVYVLNPCIKTLLQKVKKENIQFNYYSPNNYVFIKDDGTPYSPDALSAKFRDFTTRYTKRMRFHDLRHSTASILHEQGWAQKDIQSWMRHSDSYMTSYYTHLSNQYKVNMSQKVDELFSL
jgi:integrase